MFLAEATAADLDDIADLVNGAYRGETARQGWTHESDYIDGQRTDTATLRRDLAACKGAALLTLREGPAAPLLGCVWVEPAEPGVWYLGMLTVRPDQQARGLGRAVLQAAEGFIRERGAVRVRITVVGLRETLIAWYERRGFVLTGGVEPFPYDDRRFGIPRRPDLEFVVLEKAL